MCYSLRETTVSVKLQNQHVLKYHLKHGFLIKMLQNFQQIELTALTQQECNFKVNLYKF